MTSEIAASPGSAAATTSRRDPWHASYPAGVPPTLDLAATDSLPAVLERSFSRFAKRPALSCMGATWTYARLDDESRRLAAWLQSLGLPLATRVAIMMPSVPQYAVVLAAVLRAGCVVVNVNPLYTPRELRAQLVDSGAQVLFVFDQFAPTFDAVRGETPVQHLVVTGIGDVFGGPKGWVADAVQRDVRKVVPRQRPQGSHRYAELIRGSQELPFVPPVQTQDDLAVLQYTGGTTGTAKGAMLLQRNLLAAAAMTASWMQPVLGTAPRVDAPVFLVPLPLYHVFTLSIVITALSIGGRCELVPNPRDTTGLIRTMERTPFHVMIGLNTLYAALLANKQFHDGITFPAARVFVAGGMATLRPVMERWRDRTGLWIVEGWGMTETAGSGICNRADSNGDTGSIGLPMPSVSVVIRDDDGRDVPSGTVGEIFIAGPNVMAGYWQHPGDQAALDDPDGYLATGDIGVMDEGGYVRIVDRKKDMILVSGFNVYPAEIERVTADLAGVAEAAAIGTPDLHTGEAVRLFVVRSDAELTVEQVRRYCAANLTNYKRPRDIVFVDSLPKTPVGKVLRRALRGV